MEKVYDFDFVFDTQEVFRRLMDAMSHPFRKYAIAEPAKGFDHEMGLFLSIACTLLDNETSFYVEKNVALMDEVHELTLAKMEEITKADYIFLSSELNYETIKAMFTNAKKGDYYDPHHSATFVIYGETNDKTAKIQAKGPGINESVMIETSQYVKNILSIRKEMDAEYPCGIDIIFVFDDGNVLAIPRLIQTEEV